MSTNSRIGYYEDGKVKSIYCHWDGYIDNNGEILYNNYTTLEQVKRLVELGDMSSLGETPRDCITYHRDRGEELNIRTSTVEALAREENYNYLFMNGKWYVSWKDTDYRFEPLEHYL